MKKSFLASITVLLILLSSCATGTGRYGYGDGRTPEEIQLSLEILMSDAFGMAPNLKDTKADEIRALLPRSLSDYRGTLPLYDELENAYTESVLEGMAGAVDKALELFEEKKMPIPYTYDYINEKTLTGLLGESLGEEVRTEIEALIPELFPSMEGAWQKLETECTILRKNYENLSLVTEMKMLSAPEPISPFSLASFVVSEALDSMSYAEEYLRNRPLTEHSERSYQIFWEEY